MGMFSASEESLHNVGSASALRNPLPPNKQTNKTVQSGFCRGSVWNIPVARAPSYRPADQVACPQFGGGSDVAVGRGGRRRVSVCQPDSGRQELLKPGSVLSHFNITKRGKVL